ncbi:putative disease resistance RPP13-like protein 1 isoform X3 [Arachis duranensis]|uniref:Disease resistance RPP13-like protein 1 isoform X3 n=1 Tax=Arachis duranensis TaxID=130453 RepID=A0A9C6TG86_ARADU|nr:putative disease resistance RPP13-like protein 1 isoform X3 [Arachis duranensis]
MATVVGEALLSAAVEALVGKISIEISEFYRSKNLDESLLKKLNVMLLSLHAFLNDAEEKQISNPAVKAWMDQLTQALFDADDLIDDIATEALRRKVEARFHQTVTAKKVLSSPFKWPYREINSKMQKLFERALCRESTQPSIGKRWSLAMFGVQHLQILLLMILLFVGEMMKNRILKSTCCQKMLLLIVAVK